MFMGMLRIYLALSVVVAHIVHGPVFGFVSGKHAVELFFMISGFYMALVMPKYLGLENGIRTFYTARYLRLFPAYIVVFLIFVPFVRNLTDISADAPIASLYVWFVSVTMIAYESLNWVTFDPATKELAFAASTRFGPGEPYTLDMLPYMRHMWSIGVEISFYLVAPFLLRNRKTTLLFLVGALAMHWWMAQNLDPYHPLRHRSVFAYLYLFALGAVACQVTFLTLFIFELNLIRLFANRELSKDLFLVVCLLLATGLFVIMKTSNLDRQIGDLSYVIYIVHWPVVRTLAIKFPDLPYLVAWQMGLTLLIALAINFAIERPVERYRSSLATRKAAAGPVVAQPG